MTLGVQAPPSTVMQAAIGQPGGGGGALLLRTLSGNGVLLVGYREDSGFCYLQEARYYTTVSTLGKFGARTKRRS